MQRIIQCFGIFLFGLFVAQTSRAAIIDHIFHYTPASQPKQTGSVSGDNVIAYHGTGFANYGPYQKVPARHRARNIIACAEFSIVGSPDWVPGGTLGTLDMVDWSTGANPRREFNKWDFNRNKRSIFCVQSRLPAGYTGHVEVRWWHNGIAPIRMINKFFVVARTNVEYTISNQETVTISGEAGDHAVVGVNGYGNPQRLRVYGKRFGITKGHTNIKGAIAVKDLPGGTKRAVPIYRNGQTNYDAAAVIFYDHRTPNINPLKIAGDIFQLGGLWSNAFGTF